MLQLGAHLSAGMHFRMLRKGRKPTRISVFLPAAMPRQPKTSDPGPPLQAGNRTVGFYDEISTGLDSSSTLEICYALSNITHATMASTMVALLQPPPEAVDIFDDVWLMARGRLVYQGPIDQVRCWRADASSPQW